MDKWEYITKVVGGPLLAKSVETLAEYAKKVPKNGTIVDIGTCEGKSAFVLAYHSHPSVQVMTIDPTPNPRFFDHVEKLDFLNRITHIGKKSQECSAYLFPEIDMFFNDGLHEYWAVRKDNEIYCPLVKKGGLCTFDDISYYADTVGKAILDDEGKYYDRLKIIDNVYIGRKL